jgi:hypothetical protein
MTGLFLASWSFVDLLNQAEMQGIFKYVLPFLLVFALIYGILSNMKILGENKGVHVIIAIALGLLSLYGDFLPNFLVNMASNLAIGLSILLAAIILFGLFMSDDKNSNLSWIKYVLFGVSALVFIIAMYSSLDDTSFVGSWAWQQYVPAVIVLLIIAGLIAIVVSNKK